MVGDKCGDTAFKRADRCLIQRQTCLLSIGAQHGCLRLRYAR